MVAGRHPDRLAWAAGGRRLGPERPAAERQRRAFEGRDRGHRLMRLVDHDDAEREFAYDRASHIGTLDNAWDAAKARHWIVVSMKQDWKRIFAFE
jgi:hypothetical protein